MNLLVPNRRAQLSRDNFLGEFDYLLNNFFETPSYSSFKLEGDVQESDKYILLTFDIPGLEEEDINIETKDSHLSISGERKSEESEGFKNHYRGRSYGSFKRTFHLSENVDQGKIEADYTNGVLKVLIPKKPEVAAQKINIQSTKGNLLSQIFKGKETA